MAVESLYLYSNSEIVFSYFSGRQLGTVDMLPVRSFSAGSLGHLCKHFMFLTHKKLSKEYRTYGFDPEGDFQISPIVLSIDLKSSYTQPAWLLSMASNGRVKCEFKKLSLYKPEKHFGALVLAEIPLSCVSSFQFESIDDMNSFKRPSPDLWFPRDLFKLLSVEEYIDDIPCEVEAIADVVQIDANCIDAIRIADVRSRVRAMMWSTFNAQVWESNSFQYSIDPITQDAFGISDATIDKCISDYSVTKYEKYKNTIAFRSIDYASVIEKSAPDLLDVAAATGNASCVYADTTYQENGNSCKAIGEELFTLIIKQFVKIRPDARKTNEFWGTTLETFASDAQQIDRGINVCMQNLIACANMDPGCMTPDQFQKSVPSDLFIVVSLLFVVRNANNFEQLKRDLKEYRANLLVAKGANILWSFLNGMFDIPGEDCGKDNAALWSYIEECVSTFVKNEYLYSFKKLVPLKLAGGDFFGHQITSTRMASVKGIQQYFIDRITENDMSAIAACYELMCDVVDCGKPAYRLTTEIAILKDTIVSAEDYQKIVESFERITVPDAKKILAVLRDLDQFRNLVKRDTASWKKIYLSHIEKAVEKQTVKKRRVKQKNG